MLIYKENKVPTPRGVPKKKLIFLLTYNGNFDILNGQLERRNVNINLIWLFKSLL